MNTIITPNGWTDGTVSSAKFDILALKDLFIEYVNEINTFPNSAHFLSLFNTGNTSAEDLLAHQFFS